VCKQGLVTGHLHQGGQQVSTAHQTNKEEFIPATDLFPFLLIAFFTPRGCIFAMAEPPPSMSTSLQLNKIPKGGYKVTVTGADGIISLICFFSIFLLTADLRHCDLVP
jgi:hypothetical protein